MLLVTRLATPALTRRGETAGLAAVRRACDSIRATTGDHVATGCSEGRGQRWLRHVSAEWP